MHKHRLEGFSDGVLAIILTIMVLEMKVPHGSLGWGVLIPVLPIFLSYVLSFVYVGIYWNNHHHLLQAVDKVNGKVLWANLHLLFWLSLLPFVTGWMGGSHFASEPVLLYNFVLLMAALAYYLLCRSLVKQHGAESALGRAMGSDRKGQISLVAYFAAVCISPVFAWVGVALSVAVALMWVIPDRRIESVLSD